MTAESIRWGGHIGWGGGGQTAEKRGEEREEEGERAANSALSRRLPPCALPGSGHGAHSPHLRRGSTWLPTAAAAVRQGDTVVRP